MPRATEVIPLPWTFSVRKALAAWQREVPLLALTSGDDCGAHDRWSLLAPRTTSSHIRATDPSASTQLGRCLREGATFANPALAANGTRLPFAGGWIGFVGYECGALLEPRARAGGHGAHSGVDTDWPDAMFFEVPRALLYSHELRQWWEVGDPEATRVAQCVEAELAPVRDREESRRAWETARSGALESSWTASEFRAAVARATDLIRGGDIFQANVAQPFTANIEGCARAFAVDTLSRAAPRYGALLELDSTHTLLSLSPELFLEIDGATRRVLTRPMKGTRPTEAGEADLLASPKDAAELHMIVDLMRNDLGRVCAVGSVRVESDRTIERHPTVLQGVGEVSGTLSPEASLDQVFRAAFPPGSVTGAPKIRAMQVIEELEGEPRGPYCGAIGFASGCGTSMFSVGIRTAKLSRERGERWSIEYRAGCGIVAESDPDEELAESIAKTRILREALDAGNAVAQPALT